MKLYLQASTTSLCNERCTKNYINECNVSFSQWCSWLSKSFGILSHADCCQQFIFQNNRVTSLISASRINKDACLFYPRTEHCTFVAEKACVLRGMPR